jgi:hypothetical protein
MGFSFHSTGRVKRAKECWNESHTINGSPRPAKTKEELAGVNRRALTVIVPMMPTLALQAEHPRILRGLKLVRGRLYRASMAHALNDPEPSAARQARAAGQHAEPRSKQGVRLLQ